ncbi:hypothetical protein X975_23764, partial [Stegodyphus mimosarum]
MFPILAAVVLFCSTSIWAGDPCPPKAELPFCTCIRTLIEEASPEYNARFRTPPTELTTKSILTTVKIPTQFPEELNNGSFYTVVECKVSKILAALEETIPSALNRKLVDKLILTEVPP